VVLQSKALNIVFTVLICLVSLSCSDYKLHTVPDEPAPEITVSPTAIDYGPVFAGVDKVVADITISNVGTAVLHISSIELVAGDTTFSGTISHSIEVNPGNSVIVPVEYEPFTYSTNIDKVRIYSNDADEPIVDVDVSGTGDAPVIYVEPDYYSFFDIYVGCDGSIPISISNTGNIDLVINSLNHFASLPADFSLYDYEPFYGMVPLTIPPATTITLEVAYSPSDAFDDLGYLEIHSNDPMTPIAYADHDGDGNYETWVTDIFEQNETTDVDILFIVDNSGSMGSNQTNFKNNFSSFMAVFSASGVDYRIAFITTDSEQFVGSVITPADSDPVGLADSIIDTIGTSGSAMESGLYYSYLSTTSGYPASIGGGFLRDDAKLVLIYISDEPDHSSRNSTMTEPDYAAWFYSLKSAVNKIVAHAVAGDYPSGCTSNGGAQFGDGYYDLVGLLGGSFMSICDSNWGTAMDTLARESIAQTTFSLTEHAIDGTIEIEVNGVPSTGWYYDEATNSVQFTTIPAEGSIIEITYAVWSCEEE
jgi:hypothetical protein